MSVIAEDYRTQLVSIPTPTTPLDGAYYEPAGGPTEGAVLYFHGNTMNFYIGGARFLPPMLARLGFACLAFNRRGHDILSIRDDKEHLEGAAFQTTAQSLEDCTLAADWLAEIGHEAPVVIGHSNGGMMAVKHVADRPLTPALVLLSAGAGGPARSQRSGLLAGNGLERFKAEARALVDAGRGTELMTMPGWWYYITAESFLDRLETVPDILALAPRISCPTLFLRGDLEPVDTYPAERFAELSAGPTTVSILAGGDHFYRGREQAVVETVEQFLRTTIVEATSD